MQEAMECDGSRKGEKIHIYIYIYIRVPMKYTDKNKVCLF